MTYNKDYTITTLSASMDQYDLSIVLKDRRPIAPTGRIRQIVSGAPYTVFDGTPPFDTFPFGNICYNGSWVPGKIENYALKFDGADDHILVGTTTDFAWMHGKGNTSAFKWSVSFWMKFETAPSGINNLKTIISTNDLLTGAGISILFDDRGTGAGGQDRAILLLIYNASNQNIIALEQANDYPDDTNWHHVVVTFDRGVGSNNGKIYIDGAFKAQANDNAYTPSDAVSLRVLTIGEGGGGAGGYNFPGSLDDLAIWDVVLTAAEVSHLYNNNIGIPAKNIQSANLYSYWDIEDGPGNSTIKDSAGTYPGTMTSMNAGSACPYKLSG